MARADLLGLGLLVALAATGACRTKVGELSSLGELSSRKVAQKRCPANESYRPCGPDFPAVMCHTKWRIKCDEKAPATCRVEANNRIAALDALLAVLGSDRTGLANGHAGRQLDGRIGDAQREASRLHTDIGRLQAQLDAANGALPGLLEKKAQLTDATASTRTGWRRSRPS